MSQPMNSNFSSGRSNPLTTTKQADKIAVELLESSLTGALSSDFDASEIERLVQAFEAQQPKKVAFSDPNAEISQKSAARFENELENFHWYLPAAPGEKDAGEIDLARKISEKVDAYRKTSYWLPLTNYLADADVEAWRSWHAAKYAQLGAEKALRHGDFTGAKDCAIWGCAELGDAPDRRLYLSFGSRMQAAIALGDKAINLAFLLGRWLVGQGEKMGFPIFAVNVAFNMGDQLILNGRFDEADVWLTKARKLSDRWASVNLMDYYQIFVLERLSVVARRQGDLNRAKKLLEKFKKVGASSSFSSDKRIKILYQHGIGLIHEANREHDEAEEALKKAHDLAIARPSNSNFQYEDPYNAWAAKTAMACNSLLADRDPDEALNYIKDAEAFGKGLKNFMNADRSCTLEIYTAEAYIKKSDADSAQACLDRAESFLEAVDSPRLAARKRIADAKFLCDKGEKAAGAHCLDEAEAIAEQYGIRNYVDMIQELRKAC